VVVVVVRKEHLRVMLVLQVGLVVEAELQPQRRILLLEVQAIHLLLALVKAIVVGKEKPMRVRIVMEAEEEGHLLLGG
jgi:hypothetical protein